MIEIAIPGFGDLCLMHLVLDYNGTLAVDGKPVRGLGSALREVSRKLTVHIITGNTYGTAANELKQLPVILTLLPPENQAAAKLDYVNRLGRSCCACIGNGRNDRLMLRAAALSICVIQKEGTAGEAMSAAHLICPTTVDALDVFRYPQRLVAALRS
jgi:soluble P-type ATPase